jgi:transcriptional regulator with XRE-family HTH domain
MREKQTYSIREVAELTGFSRQTITRMFEGERGVLIIERPETLYKRKHRSIRIPHVVYERVIRRLAIK